MYMKTGLLALGVLMGVILAALIGGIGGYMYGVDRGYSDGYNAGYDTGYHAGYDTGEMKIMCRWLDWCTMMNESAHLMSIEGEVTVENVIQAIMQDVLGDEGVQEMLSRCSNEEWQGTLCDTASIGIN